jgi:D-glycero-D-manno-heptose 1,7-bisphosphate phosphatase
VPIKGSIEAIARLSNNGYHVYIATNQSGLARGFYSENTLAQMHAKLIKLLSEYNGFISGIFYCPHHPDDKCSCRKPLPGLIDQIENHFGSSAEGAYFIGDSLSDLQAARVKKCRPILVNTGKGRKTIEKGLGDFSDAAIFANLDQAVEAILQGKV